MGISSLHKLNHSNIHNNHITFVQMIGLFLVVLGLVSNVSAFNAASRRRVSLHNLEMAGSKKKVGAIPS